MQISHECCLRVGRYDPLEKQTELWWSGAGIVTKLYCTYLKLDIESFAQEHAPWIGVMVDGAAIARFPLLPGRHVYPALAGMDAAVSHEITIQRDSQPTIDETGPIILHGIDTDGQPAMPEKRQFMIEFIGDSLTVGEGCTGPKSADEWRMAWLCNMAAFPTIVAESMQAEKRVIALSGWGTWKSWDGMEQNRIGRIYEMLCGAIPAGEKPYGFQERPADAVVINLGTNDANAYRQSENQNDAAQQITKRAEELMTLVRKHQPNAWILWAYGLCGNDIAPFIREAVANRENAGDDRVAYLALDDCQGDVGSRQHPSRAAHRHAAEQILRELRQRLAPDEKEGNASCE